MNLILLVLAGIFVNNYVMSQFLGICPFLGVSKKVDTAAGMGMAVIFVMALAAAAAWLVYNLILVPLHITILILHNLMKSVFRKILHILHSADRIFGTVRRNVPEKICTCSVSGSGCIPAPDYNKLRSIGCSRYKYAEGLQLHRIRSERSWWCCRFCSGNHPVCRYS